MSEHRLELELSDSFHRIKRTLLLLSGTLVLLGSSNTVLEIQSRFVGDASPSTSVLRLGLLVAATYYLWGFYHEFQAAKRTNSPLIDPSTLPQYEFQIGSFTEQLGFHVQNASKALADTKPRLEVALSSAERSTTSYGKDVLAYMDAGVKSVADKHATFPAEKLTERAALNRAEKEASVAHSLRRIVIESNEHISRTSGKLAEVGNAVARLEEQTLVLIQVAERAADRIRLNRAIYRDRKVSLFGWELGGALGAYIAAVVCTITPLGFKAGDLIESGARAFVW